jgi:hypothetical protein
VIFALFSLAESRNRQHTDSFKRLYEVTDCTLNCVSILYLQAVVRVFKLRGLSLASSVYLAAFCIFLDFIMIENGDDIPANPPVFESGAHELCL